MIFLKKGYKGNEVKKLQSLLKITVTGVFDGTTENAVRKFQLNNHIAVDGFVSNETWTLLMANKNSNNEAIDEDSDTLEQYFKTEYDQLIHRYYLPRSEYVVGKPANQFLFLHHTASNADPYRVVDSWSRDSRGKVCTEFVVGGQNYITSDDQHDGVVVQAFPEGSIGWHLGKTGSGFMNRNSVGVEICSIGYLNSDQESYIGKKAHNDQVIKLENPFRGRTSWHRYSDRQIKEIENLIKHIARRDNIDVRLGLQQWIKKYGPNKAFDFHEDAYYGKVRGLLSHGNVRKGKMDCYPDPRLAEMILNL